MLAVAQQVGMERKLVGMLEDREQDHLEGMVPQHHLVGKELHPLGDMAFHLLVGRGRGQSYLVGKEEPLFQD